ncbi:MAG: sel1 repeat family protein, partial [Burkholderiales bacterium]
LGSMYAFGQGVPAAQLERADRLAATWYFAAARQGHVEAQYGLGVLFIAGKGVQRDEAEALKWMRRAADQGHADALNYVRGYTPAR